MKRVSIITVNYNYPEVTEALLQSIHSLNTYGNIEVIVVDNGSTNNPVPGWEQRYSDVTFIRSEVNLGFAGGNNLGVSRSDGDYLFFVNNDTEFTAELIVNMVLFMDSNIHVGLSSPKICYYDQPDIIQYVGFTEMNYYTCRNSCIGQYQRDNGQYDRLSGSTGYAHGAAMMVRREVIERVGLMHENYFLYYEELDWAERIKKNGYDIAVNTEALIYHKESMTVGRKSGLKEYFMNRNRILFIRKNAPRAVLPVFFCYFMGVVMPRSLWGYLRNKQFNFIKPFFKAIWWNVANSKNSSYLGHTTITTR